MTNVKKAIAAMNEVDDYIDFLPDNAAYVHALEAKGLIAPDLPERSVTSVNGNPVWREPETLWVWAQGGEVFVNVDPDHYMAFTPEKARQQAHTLLAAADYAEKEKDNGQ